MRSWSSWRFSTGTPQLDFCFSCTLQTITGSYADLQSGDLITTLLLLLCSISYKKLIHIRLCWKWLLNASVVLHACLTFRSSQSCFLFVSPFFFSEDQQYFCTGLSASSQNSFHREESKVGVCYYIGHEEKKTIIWRQEWIYMYISESE